MSQAVFRLSFDAGSLTFRHRRSPYITYYHVPEQLYGLLFGLGIMVSNLLNSYLVSQFYFRYWFGVRPTWWCQQACWA